MTAAEPTMQMTVGQALVVFLARQWTLDGAVRERTVPGVFGIFGHGNVAGLGQALAQAERDDPGLLPYLCARNEQAMVHQAVGYARAHRRHGTYAATSSVGPGTANLVTGAALATANRLPVLLLVSDTFSSRVADPVLQQLEHPDDPARQVVDALRPVSRFFARVERGEQLFSIALAALRVLTDPAETGAVTIALPEDVQAEAIDVPADFLAERHWNLHRPPPDPGALARAAAAIHAAQRPLIVAGGGVYYSGAEAQLRAFAEATGIPVATTQAGGGVLPAEHPLNVGGIGVTGSAAANSIAGQADLVIGIGTRYSDFTTGSGTVFADPKVRLVNFNIAAADAAKHTQLSVICDARAGLAALSGFDMGSFVTRLKHRTGASVWGRMVSDAKRAWDVVVDRATAPTGAARPGQPEILGALRDVIDPRDVIVAAAGSLPGDLQKLWRPTEALGYHVEYGFSCMGYEIAGGLGYKRGLIADRDDREVVVLVGDGSYLMLHTELATAAAEGVRLIVVVIDNGGFASIGRLSESVGAQRLGTGADAVPRVDYAANARSYGAAAVDVADGPNVLAELADAIAVARTTDGPTVVVVPSDPLIAAPDNGAWWDVPVAQVSTTDSVHAARAAYRDARCSQRRLLG